jgi:hypothetical protein
VVGYQKLKHSSQQKNTTAIGRKVKLTRVRCKGGKIYFDQYAPLSAIILRCVKMTSLSSGFEALVWKVTFCNHVDFLQPRFEVCGWLVLKRAALEAAEFSS